MDFEIEFKPDIEDAIRRNKPLYDWFLKNQTTLNYFGLVHDRCLHFEGDSLANGDLRSLGRMAYACFICLEGKVGLSADDRAMYAMQCVHEVYELEKEHLTDSAKNKYAINVDEFHRMSDASSSKMFVKSRMSNEKADI